MGVSHNGLELAAKMGTAAAGMAALPLAAMGQAALAGKATFLASARVAAPGMRLNTSAKGSRLGVRYNVGGYPSGAAAIIFATGAWPLIESDTPAHEIGPKKRRGKKGTAAVKLPGGVIRRTVRHPGTRGKHPWAEAAPVVVRATPEIFRREMVAGLARVF